MIPSVQIQHNATYVCKCTNDRYFKKLFGIIVSGFVPKFTQNPKSYIVLPVMLKSNSKFGAEISFKANKEDGKVSLFMEMKKKSLKLLQTLCMLIHLPQILF